MIIKIEFDPWDEHRQAAALDKLLTASGLTVERVEVLRTKRTYKPTDPNAELVAKIKESIA